MIFYVILLGTTRRIPIGDAQKESKREQNHITIKKKKSRNTKEGSERGKQRQNSYRKKRAKWQNFFPISNKTNKQKIRSHCMPSTGVSLHT